MIDYADFTITQYRAQDSSKETILHSLTFPAEAQESKPPKKIKMGTLEMFQNENTREYFTNLSFL
jgi:hypothetical protein